jgi:DNA-binding transcriptional MerR regulator
VARLTGVQPYILRYWESEFSVLQPKKSGTGQRLYRKKDIQTLLKIKHLLYDQKFTIAGAKRRLLSEGGGEAPADLPEVLRRLREGLEGLAALLRKR